MKRPALIASALIALVAIGLVWWLQRLDPLEAPLPPAPTPPVAAGPVATPSAPAPAPTAAATPEAVKTTGRAALAGVTRSRINPVSGALITFRSTAGELATGTSGAEGRFRVEVSPGEWSVQSVENDDYVLVSKSTPLVHLTAGSVVDGLELELERKFEQRGLVVDETNTPVADALVMGTVRTGDDGRYVYRGPGIRTVGGPGMSELAGRLANVLTVEHPCCLRDFEVTRERGEGLIIHLRQRAPSVGTLSGTVVDSKQAPLAGAEVSVHSWFDGGGSQVIVTTTDAQGRFSVGVPTPTGTVTASIPHAGISDAEDYEVGRPVMLVIAQLTAPHLRGRVIDAKGQPVTHFLLRAMPDRRERELHTADGRFDVEVVAFPSPIAIRTPSSNEPQFTTMGLFNRGDVDLGDVVLPAPETTVTLEVFDEGTQAPLANVSVQGQGEFRGRTDEAGRLAVEIVSTPAEFRFTLRGYVHRQVPITKEMSVVRVGLRPESVDGGNDGVEFEGVGMRPTEWGPDGGRGSVWISEVHPTGPARAAGVLPGDELLAVDDVSSVSMGLTKLMQRIKGPAGSTVKLTFKRDGRVFDVRVQRQRLTW